MAKLKKFDEYLVIFSKDPKTFEKKIAFANKEGIDLDVFEVIRTPFDEAIGNFTPTIIWNNFDFRKSQLNESKGFSFNSTIIPESKKILASLEGEDFMPQMVTERSQVKSMKFPIVAINGDDSEVFRTYGQFKKSEKRFSKFYESIKPDSIFDVIAFKNKPIHIQETVNGVGFDVEVKRFKHLPRISEITKSVNSKQPTDFYHMQILERAGKLYLSNVDTSTKLSPTQGSAMYIKAYESFYERALPNWFKNQLFEKNNEPYYSKRYYDSLLLKPKYSIDLSKYSKA